MIPINHRVVMAIFNASKGYLTMDEVDDVVETLTIEETEDFMILIKTLTILNDGEAIMSYPANLYPV